MLSEIKELKEVKEFLLTQDRFLILMHSKPDGDALGAAYGLLKFLHNNNKEAFIGIEEPIFYKYMGFFPQEDIDKYFVQYQDILESDFSFITVVDTSSYNLLGLFKNLVLNHLDNTMIIDHHIVKEPLEPKNYISHVSSTCEIILNMIGVENLDFNMAQALYMGIVFDTGQFRHSSSSAHVFRAIASILDKFEINLEDVYYNLFENETIERKKLRGELAYNTEFFANGKIAVSYLSIDLIEKLRKEGIILTEDDMMDLVVVPHSIKGVEVSVMIREKKDQTTFSFRSRCSFNVSDFASNYGGGGHKKASGLKIPKKSYTEIKETILKPLEEKFLENC